MLQKSLHILMQVDASSCANLVLNGAAFFSARNLQKKKKTFATKHARRTGFLWEAAFTSFLYNFIERVSAESLSQSP